jgi:hypothetical protein
MSKERRLCENCGELPIVYNNLCKECWREARDVVEEAVSEVGDVLPSEDDREGVKEVLSSLRGEDHQENPEVWDTVRRLEGFIPLSFMIPTDSEKRF